MFALRFVGSLRKCNQASHYGWNHPQGINFVSGNHLPEREKGFAAEGVADKGATTRRQRNQAEIKQAAEIGHGQVIPETRRSPINSIMSHKSGACRPKAIAINDDTLCRPNRAAGRDNELAHPTTFAGKALRKPIKASADCYPV